MKLTTFTVLLLAMRFIVILSLGPEWDRQKPASDQQYFADHSANLRKLREQKKILIGGRYSDKGMLFVEAETEADVRSMFDADPMVKNKLFTIEVFPFSAFYTGCINP